MCGNQNFIDSNHFQLSKIICCFCFCTSTETHHLNVLQQWKKIAKESFSKKQGNETFPQGWIQCIESYQNPVENINVQDSDGVYGAFICNKLSNMFVSHHCYLGHQQEIGNEHWFANNHRGDLLHSLAIEK